MHDQPKFLSARLERSLPVTSQVLRMKRTAAHREKRAEPQPLGSHPRPLVMLLPVEAGVKNPSTSWSPFGPAGVHQR
jgi:hypothetical protein